MSQQVTSFGWVFSLRSLSRFTIVESATCGDRTLSRGDEVSVRNGAVLCPTMKGRILSIANPLSSSVAVARVVFGGSLKVVPMDLRDLDLAT